MKRIKGFNLFVGILTLLLVSACARQEPQPATSQPANTALPQSDSAVTSSDSSAQPLPFAKAGTAADNSSAISRLVPSSELTIPAGTPVAVRLQASLSSANSLPGQQFDAVLAEPLVINGQTVAPRGAPAIGRVTAARKSGRLHNSGYLRLTLASVSVKGQSVPVQTSSVSVAGGSHRNRNLAWIGGGTGAGALIGALAGGGKGALIGSAIGAAGGTTTAFATGQKDVGFGAERRLTFRLVQPLKVRG
jgi:hypothetical protein